MSIDLHRYAGRNAPRYTSYPTAPHFHADIDGAVFADWLGALAPEAPLSLYIHVPYCREICWYCGCNTSAAAREEPIARYVETLLAEIDLLAEATPARRVRAIHWGGGTPNILKPDAFRTVMERLAARFDLDALEDHAVEVDPRHLSEEQARAYAERGVNRASIGVQDVNEDVQEAMGRVQPIELVASTVEILRAAGIARISADLMYGLPRQTTEDAHRSARAVAALQFDRVSVFGYAHVPWFKSRQRLIDEASLPDAEARLRQQAAAHEALVSSGYVPVGIDHYARPEDPLAAAAEDRALRRNFQGYVHEERMALIGLGPSAISTLEEGYAQNISETGAWGRAIAEGRLATARGRALSADDRLRGGLIENLLCAFEVDLSPHGGRTAFPDAMDALEPLVADGLASLDGESVRIPDDARPFARLVAETFDAYRETGGARHSRAV